MDHALIPDLLRPYYEGLSREQYKKISTYIDLLLRWNAKMNLTAVRDPENIVKRHFGEAIFLARELSARHLLASGTVVYDIGSGAGFPGIPLKIARPEISLTLVEAHGRKAIFLKEVLRAVNLDAEVKNVRAEDLARTAATTADIVTLRAVEKFDSILPVAAQFLKLTGALALLISKTQVAAVQKTLNSWQFCPLLPIPGSESRGILLLNQSG